MPTHTVTRTYKDESASGLSFNETITSEVAHNLDKAMSIGTNVQIALAFTRSKLKSIVISADGPCTIFTNAPSGGSPQDTIALVANQVLIWTLATDAIARCPFAGDVTTAYVTNAGIVNLKIRSMASN
jgi:hypothetical protein